MNSPRKVRIVKYVSFILVIYIIEYIVRNLPTIQHYAGLVDFYVIDDKSVDKFNDLEEVGEENDRLRSRCVEDVTHALDRLGKLGKHILRVALYGCFAYGFVVLQFRYVAFTYIIYLHGVNFSRYSDQRSRSGGKFVIIWLPRGKWRPRNHYVQANGEVLKLFRRNSRCQ